MSIFERPIYGKESSMTSGEKAKSVFHPTINMVQVKRATSIPKQIPGINEIVICQRKGIAVCLRKAIMTDHISITYSTDNPAYYIKIYTKDALQIDLIQNIVSRMLEAKVCIPGVCWPLDTICNRDGAFVGILVPSSRGIQLTKSIYNGSAGLSQFFPYWNKQDLCQVTLTILEIIRKMHNIGVMFGCINPASIYIVNPKEVYFVDTDCWQIEGFPSFSRNQTFTPPEMLRSNQQRFLYTLDQENYQIALLVFMLMLPGKFPYAKWKSVENRDSIVDMAFPFSVGGGMRRSRDAEHPSGVWRIVWDHLSYKMCEAFYNTFHANGINAKEGCRLKVEDWIRITSEYNRRLSAPSCQDSLELFPKTFRRDKKRTFVRCQICGQEHPDFYFLRNVTIAKTKVDVWEKGYRICIPCANDQSDMSFVCQCCNRQFFYTNRSKIIHAIGESDFDFKRQKWCKSCKKQTFKCVRCGKEVPIFQIREFQDKKRNMQINVCQSCFKELIEEVKKERNQRSARRSRYFF